jgi:murein DD-endopeptidase MepM/ murein hydrolase activator NlpD
MVVQGPDGSFSHQGTHAFDFALAIGTPVLAARRGVVTRVIDGFTKCCLPPEEGHKMNGVIVEHRDGTYAVYAHLRVGIPVKEGERVKARQLIAYSGNTGVSFAPHLHFEVNRRDEAGAVEGIEFRFRDGTPEGAAPGKGEYVNLRPKPTVELQLRAGEQVFVKEEMVRVNLGETLRLTVVRRGLGGGWIDVTRHPATRYGTATPWLVEVNEIGRTVFRRGSRWRGPLAKSITGSVTAIYEDPETGRLGFADAVFDVLDPNPASAPPP